MTCRSSVNTVSNYQLSELLEYLALEEPVATESCERDVVNRIDASRVLERIEPHDREIIELISGYNIPADYNGAMPPTAQSTGTYIGLKRRGKPLTARTIRMRCAIIRRRSRALFR